MLGTIVNVNYFLGFVIVVLGFVSAFLFLRPKYLARLPSAIPAAHAANAARITLITATGPINMSRSDLDQYLTKLINNIEFIAKNNSEWQAADKMRSTRDKFAAHITSIMEACKLSRAQIAEIAELRAKLPHFVTLSHAKYDNDQNEDAPGVEVLYEIMQDMETLLYLTKVMRAGPEATYTIDVGEVDKLVRRLYQRAQASSPPVTVSVSRIPTLQSNPSNSAKPSRSNPDAPDNSDSHNFCTIADLFEHQDVVAETDVFSANRWTSPQSGTKTRKQGLKSAKAQSLDTATQKRGSSHGPTPERRVTFNIPDNSNRDMQETMSLDRRKQRKQPAPRKDSLNGAYSDDQLATAD